ncbi:MAG TPA: ABC transporter ATP-binding protein [Desulfomonilia bacterium]
MSTQSPLLSIESFKVSRGGVEVVNVNRLDIEKGSHLTLIGPNGAGKSSLLLAAAGLLKPSSGTIRFRGERVSRNKDMLDYRRSTACIFQEALLFDTSVYANISSGLRFRKASRKDINEMVNLQAERFGIAHLLKRSARTLSGGEAQRVSLARAFAVMPDIIFMDEPFSALDKPTRDTLIDDFGKVLKETGTTAVMVTHDQDEALRLSTEIAVMDKGIIVQRGAPVDVMNHPENEFIASFMGMESLIEGIVKSSENNMIVGETANKQLAAIGRAEPGERVLLGIRPENITVSTSRDLQTSARNVFAGTITRIVPKSFYLKVDIDCGFSLTAYVTENSAAELMLKEGSKVTASFKATGVHVIKKPVR